jgi:preprotein translocase subunit SecG
MGFLIALLTLVMVVDCLILILLVLIQLPKKEAGAGLAFGGGATDALFGAGSGNVLTNITKYVATAFFVMAIILSILQNIYHNRNQSTFGSKLGQVPLATPLSAPPGVTPVAPLTVQTSPPASGTNPIVAPLAPELTNVPQLPASSGTATNANPK